MSKDNPLADIPVVNLNDYATNEDAFKSPPPANDLEGPNNPGVWPFRPMCHVVKRKGDGSWPECATVLEGEPGRVYHIGMHELTCVNQGMQKAALGDAKVTEYGSWEKMLADGWVCD